MDDNQMFRSKTWHSRIQGPSSMKVWLLTLKVTHSFDLPEITPRTTQCHVPDDRDIKTKSILLFAEEK